MWLDGADTNTLFSDSGGTTPATVGGTIGYWKDKSADGRHYTQATAANRPLYDALGSVTFNTSAHYLTYSGTWTTGGWDVFTVSTPLVSTANWKTMWRGATTDHPTLIESGSTRLGYYHNASLGFQQFGSLTFAGGTRRLLYVSISSSRAYSAALDGTVATSAAGGNGTADTQMFYSLGSSSAGGQPWGTINEVIIVPNTTLTQRQQIEGYLAWKWGLQANLPTGHSFRPNPTAMRIFQPNDIAGLQLWFDGLDPNGNGTVPANNAALSTWVDKSGTGNSGTASGTTPLYQSGSGVLFSTGAYLTNYSASLTNESLFFVYTPTTSTASIVLAGPSANGGRTLINNTNLRLESSSYFVAFGSLTPDGTVPLNQRCQSAYVITSGSSVVVHNGVTYSPVSLSFTGGLTTRIGAAGSTLTQFFKGTIHEVIAYNVALTASQRQQIEGYLAAKWGLSSSLPTTQPYYLQRALPSTPLFTPVNVSNCRLWLDAADRSRITFGTGSNISNWTDKSSNGYTFSQATSISQAVYVENSLNGLPVVSLTTNKGLTGTTFSPNGLTAMSLFAVVNNTGNQNPATNTNFQFLGWNETGGWGQVYLGAYTPFMEWRFGTGQAENKPFANFQSNVGASYNVLSVSKSGTSEPAYRNGTLLSNYTAANTTISGTGSTTRIGLNSAQNNLAELIVYSGAITTRERQQIEGYLAWKWGLQNSLPTTHPYYKFRP